ncbi:MAG: hypothetical protein U0744_06090 [Gemmataceae bacterium]
MLWFLTPESHATNVRLIPDFNRYPEIRWLDRWDLLPPAIAAACIYGLGALLGYAFPNRA